MEDNKYVQKLCINCSTPVDYDDEDHHHNFEDFLMEPTHFPSNCTTTTTNSSSRKGWWINALYSIFKLNYLSAFDSFEEDQIEKDDVCFCSNCSEILNSLYQLENEFLVLGKIDSYLKKKLDRLDSIIDSHRQKTIHCDFLIGKEDGLSNYDVNVSFNEYNTNSQNSDSFVVPSPTTTNTNNSSNAFGEKEPIIRPTTTTTSIFDREPRIILTRLPPNYSQMQPTDSKQENDDIGSNDNSDDETIVSLPDQDDDYIASSPSVQSDNLIEGSSEDDESDDDPDFTFSHRIRSTRNSSSGAKKSYTNSVTGDQKELVNPNPAGRRKSAKKKSYYVKKGSQLGKPKHVRTPEQKARRKAEEEYSQYLAKRANFLYPCWYCKKTDFGTLVDLMDHTTTDHLPSLLAYAESQSSSSSSAMDYTICDRCTKVNFGTNDLTFHQSKCNSIPTGVLIPPKYQCSECSKIFATQYKLQSHMLCHSNDGRYYCDECDYRTNWSTALKFHKIRNHQCPENVRKRKDQKSSPNYVEDDDDADLTFSHGKRATRNSSSVAEDQPYQVGQPKSAKKKSYYVKKGRQLSEEPKQVRTPEQKARRKAIEEYNQYLAKRAKFLHPCWYCKKANFGTLVDLKDHTTTDHLPSLLAAAESHSSSSMDYTVCDRCTKISFSADDLTFHRSKCDSIPTGVLIPPKYPCSECSKVFSTQCKLQAHKRYHSNDGPYWCDECDFRAKGPTALTSHKVRKHHCPEEDSQTSGFECPDCGVQLKSKKVWYSHRKFMHTTEGKEKYVKKLTKERNRTKQVKELNPVVLPTICEDCQIDFFSRLAFINHRRIAHADNLDKEHICHVCGTSFARAFSLATHTRRVHSDERPFLCPSCGKRFKAGYNLKSHMEQVHTLEGKLKYRAFMKERTQRKRLIARQLENVKRQQQQQQQAQIPGQFSNLDGPAGEGESSSCHGGGE